MKKLIYVVAGIILILVILMITRRKSVHHEIIINNSSKEVWNVLISMDKYPEWNPVMELLHGEVEEGNKVTYKFTQSSDSSYEIQAMVKEIVTGQLLNQSGGTPLILTYDHKYILEQVEEGTRVTIHEDYGGIGVNFWSPKPVEEAYARLNEAIKTRVESLK
ncbi:SRPBCC domain-containing protein [Flagellimonas sp.]|uniref:SRPBCC domain-containing protein n=1 Tax=Flagellimonas sp. TaxID=2058762 RepID=UPI003F4A3CEB